MELALKVDMSAYIRGMNEIGRRQLPFAMAQALTATAGRAGLAWQSEMTERLDRPTPFTVNSVAVIPARKAQLVATVLIKDVAAQYLEPFVDGGPHFLGGKRGLLTPKGVPLNAYGNLTRKKLAALKARPDVFVGPVTLRDGQVINGVWQRGARGQRRGKLGPYGKGGGYGTKGANAHNRGMGVTSLTTLKLLIRFTDAQPVKQRLDFRGRADQAVRQSFAPEFTRAFNRAIATMK